MKKLLLTFLLLISPCSWAGWFNIIKDDKVSISLNDQIPWQSGNLVRGWTIIDLSAPSDTGVLSYLALDEYDCKEQKSRIIQMTAHSEKQAAGRVIEKIPELDEWDHIPPTGSRKVLIDLFCALRKKPL